MKAAICQFGIILKEKEQNIQKAEKRIAESAAKGCEIIFFPELSFTGFSKHISLIGDVREETVSQISRFAKMYGIAIGFGWAEHTGKKARNHYTVIDRKGMVLSDYIKIHPFSYSHEDEYFEGGDRLSRFSFAGMEFGTVICYDLRFPEIFQFLSRDAHFITVAANWPESRKEHWKCLLQARAIENQVYILGINCVGKQNNLYFSGDSCIINPNGEVLDMLSDQEGLIIVDLTDDVEEFRRKFPVKTDRKEDLYKKLFH